MSESVTKEEERQCMQHGEENMVEAWGYGAAGVDGGENVAPAGLNDEEYVAPTEVEMVSGATAEEEEAC